MSELSDLRVQVAIQEGSLAQAARELDEAKALRRRIEALCDDEEKMHVVNLTNDSMRARRMVAVADVRAALDADA